MKFKTEREKMEYESGALNEDLQNKVNLWIEWLKYRAPGYEPTITSIYRSVGEYRTIYGDPDKKAGIHSYWRAIDFRTKDMPGSLANDCKTFFNLFPYDIDRPRFQTCLYGSGRHKNHLHIQQAAS